MDVLNTANAIQDILVSIGSIEPIAEESFYWEWNQTNNETKKKALREE